MTRIKDGFSVKLFLSLGVEMPNAGEKLGGGSMVVASRQKTQGSAEIALARNSEGRTSESYERELRDHAAAELDLRKALAAEEALLRQKDDVIQRQEALRKEADHRFLNNLQMIVSLLSLQSRASANAETASQLAIAAKRVAVVERVHRRLQSERSDSQTVAVKRYLADLCGDFVALMPWTECSEPSIVVEGNEVELPAQTAVPLGFVVNELITNAVKHGQGKIEVKLTSDANSGCALSVSNDGPALPEGFDPSKSKGLGMRIIRSFVDRIGGELRIGRCDGDQGARFTVLFPCSECRHETHSQC